MFCLFALLLSEGKASNSYKGITFVVCKMASVRNIILGTMSGPWRGFERRYPPFQTSARASGGDMNDLRIELSEQYAIMALGLCAYSSHSKQLHVNLLVGCFSQSGT